MSPTPIRRVVSLWWPLALSWLLMGVEMPAYTAVVARLPESESNLAAFSGLVYPVALVVEAPVIMLLGASTALTRDWATFMALRTFAIRAGVVLTALHAMLAFTPLFDFVANSLLALEPQLVEPARTGLKIMLPWSAAIGWRRFLQGALIRCGHPRTVVAGTAVRILTNGIILWVGYVMGGDGMVIGTAAIAGGCVSEALFATWCAARFAVPALRAAKADDPPLRGRAFAAFYVPLMATPLITLLIQPLGSAAMSRMPDSVRSLAAWSSVYGLVFIFRTPGFAFNEVVVTLLGERDYSRPLRRFATLLSITTFLGMALVAFTPLSRLWFESLMGLEPDLVELAVQALPWAVLMPTYAVMQNGLQGVLVHRRTTRPITEAVCIYLIGCTALLAVGVAVQPPAGIVWVLTTFVAAGLLQTAWLARAVVRPR